MATSPQGGRTPVRLGLVLAGRELEPLRDACVWLRGDGVLESIESSATCPPDARGSPRYILAPPAAIAHAHSADRLFPEYGTGETLEKLVAPPHGEKHRRLSRLSVGDLERAAKTYYGEAERLGAGLIADFRELGGLGCVTAKGAARTLRHVRVLALGRPGPGFPEGCDGLGLSSPLDYPPEELARLAGMFTIRAVHVAETPRMRLSGDLEVALDAGFNVMVHGTHLSPSDLRGLADHGAGLVLCVSSNMWHSVGLPLVREAFSVDGLRIGIGTDNASWNPPDPWSEARVLLLVARLQGARDSWAARRVLESLLVEGYEMFGLEPPLIGEGRKILSGAVLVDVGGAVDSEDVYSGVIKRVRPTGLRLADLL